MTNSLEDKLDEWLKGRAMDRYMSSITPIPEEAKKMFEARTDAYNVGAADMRDYLLATLLPLIQEQSKTIRGSYEVFEMTIGEKFYGSLMEIQINDVIKSYNKVLGED